MHHITRNFLQRGRCGLLMVVDMKLVYSFNISDLIKYMWVGGRRHCGRQGQQGGEDQGGRWYLYVSHQIYISWNFLQLECDMLWWWRLTWNLFIPSTCLTTFSQYELVVNGIVDNKEGKTRKVADIRMYHVGWNYLQLECDMLGWWWLTSKFFILSTIVTPFRSCVLMVDDTVDSKDN